MDEYLILAVILFAVALIAACAIALVVLVGLPHDYLCASQSGPAHAARGLLDTSGVVLKNVLGSVLIVVAAAGMLLLDFPGKTPMLRKLLNRPAVLRPINRLRSVFARAPLMVD